MATETVENYLKAAYALCRESATGEAGMTRLAAMVGVTTGTATTMVKKLAAAKLARYERFGGVTLTPKGTKAAVDILRRHRLIETFLVDVLKIDWTLVHAEAERLEHAISPAVLEALDLYLGHPSVDPHGDPIPHADGKVREARGKPLSQFVPGSRVRVARIVDQDADFLSFIARHGLRPGALAGVLAVDPAAQSISVESQGHAPVSLSLVVGAKIIVDLA